MNHGWKEEESVASWRSINSLEAMNDNQAHLSLGTYLSGAVAKVIEARFHEQRRRVDFNRRRMDTTGR